jgi:hypothetical protein
VNAADLYSPAVIVGEDPGQSGGDS